MRFLYKKLHIQIPRLGFDPKTESLSILPFVSLANYIEVAKRIFIRPLDSITITAVYTYAPIASSVTSTIRRPTLGRRPPRVRPQDRGLVYHHPFVSPANLIEVYSHMFHRSLDSCGASAFLTAKHHLGQYDGKSLSLRISL